MQIKSYNFCSYSPYRLNDYMLPCQGLDKNQANTQNFVQNFLQKKSRPKARFFDT